MNKNDIKRILISMQSTENQNQVNNLLGKIDLLSKEKLQSMIIQIGNDERSIKKYFEEKLNKKLNNGHKEHTPINNMFTYGVSGSCIHLQVLTCLFYTQNSLESYVLIIAIQKQFFRKELYST